MPSQTWQRDGNDETYDLVKFFVLLVGILGEVIIEVVLSDGIYNVVCHSMRRLL